MFSFTLFTASPSPCDLVDHLDATDPSVVHSPAELHLELEVFLDRCEIGSLPSAGTFRVFERLRDLLDAPGTDAEVVERSLTVARVAQNVRDTSLVGTMVGVALELQAQGRLRTVDPGSLADHTETLWDLADSPPLDLAYERKAIREFDTSQLSWRDALFFSWAVDGNARATHELQHVLDGPNPMEGLQDWAAANPAGQAWTPWGQVAERGWAGFPYVLMDWVKDRGEADRGWRALATGG